MTNDYHAMLEYYLPQYGQETQSLFAAMLAPQPKIALINPFIDAQRQSELFSTGSAESAFGPHMAMLPSDVKPQDVDGLLSHYFLDRSSCLAPSFLPIAPSDRVLDMCSAPGGKLLIMLGRKVQNSFFVANDISKSRLLRLRQVMNSYVPKGIQASSMQLLNRDATFFGLKQANSFDAILLDAPCSSEAHVLQNPQLLHRFSPQKSLPNRQYSLLCAALLAAKTGGHIMYATCSINKAENEGVIKKLLQKKGEHCSVVPIKSPLGESNEFGTTILPHLHGAGPAFFSLLRKTN